MNKKNISNKVNISSIIIITTLLTVTAVFCRWPLMPQYNFILTSSKSIIDINSFSSQNNMLTIANISVPDPNNISVSPKYSEYHYIFYADSKTKNSHIIYIRAYHVYIYGIYQSTGVEAQWSPALWGYSDERWFDVLINAKITDQYHDTSDTYIVVYKTFYYVFNGGEYLTMVARGKFNGYTGYWDGILTGSCTVPTPYWP